jgi:U6 snRNA-associated Sm-like protein LSm6
MSTGGADKPGSGGGGGGAVKTPSDFLKSIRGRPVVVKLNSGVDYRGIALSLAVSRAFLQSEPKP